MRSLGLSVLLTLLAGCHAPAEDGPVRVAVASNFQDVQSALAQRFTEITGILVEHSSGATGQLYAQIIHGAPFHVFLAADADRPDRLEREGKAVAGTRFVYALGTLALLAPEGVEIGDGAELLRAGAYAHLAIANPETAPYGAAALEVIEHLGIVDAVAGKIVQAESIAQACQFVVSGAADLGMVARSHLGDTPASQYWIVPEDLYTPMRQEAILLRPGAHHAGGQAYLEFLRTPEARALIEAAGYRVPD